MGDGRVNTATAPVQELADVLGWTKQSQSGLVYFGPCVQCADPRASIGKLGYSCPVCEFALTLEDFVAWRDQASSDGLLPRAIPASEAVDDPPVFIVDELLLEAELHLIVGDGGVGKTSAVIALAGALVTGFAVFDRFPVRSSGPVLVISEEDSAGVLKNRALALAIGHGWPVEEVMSGLHLIAQGGARIDEGAWQAHIIEEAQRVGARAVIVDPLFDVTGGEENSNTEAKEYIRFLRRLAKETSAAVIVLHHAGKASEGKRKVDRIRGASALYSAARAVFFTDADDRGLAIDPVKFNRAAPPTRFVLERTIEAEPDNRAVWRSARIRYLTKDAAQERGAEKLVRDTLAKASGLTTTDLKAEAKGTGITAVEMSAAIKALKNTGEIEFEQGPKNAKLWRLSACRDSAGNHGNQSLPGCQSLPGNQGTPPPVVAPTRKGQPEASGNRDGRQSDVDDLLEVSA